MLPHSTCVQIVLKSSLDCTEIPDPLRVVPTNLIGILITTTVGICPVRTEQNEIDKFALSRDGTRESSHDSGGGILGYLLHEISGQIVVGNSNGCSNKLDFDM